MKGLYLGRALLLVCFCLLPLITHATPLQQAISNYEQENYEEALELLETLRASDAGAELSYYLGMTYHAMGDAAKAILHLEEAAQLGKSSAELYQSLAEAALAVENPGAALAWLETGEAAGYRSGELAFLKGSVLARQKNYPQALQELDRAEKLSPELTPKIDYLRAQIHVAGNDYGLASQALQRVINSAPESNLAASAREFDRQYRKTVDEYRPWQGNLQIGYMYDSNAIAAPETPIPGLPDEQDNALNARLRLEYAPRPAGKFFHSVRYTINTVIYDENSTSDQLANDLSYTPGYQLQQGTFSLPLEYSHLLRDGDNYEQTFSLTPTFNYNLAADRVLQFGVGYSYRDILFDFANAATEALESRAGDILLARVGYYSLFADRRGMTSVRYDFTDEATDGIHWESQGHRLALSTLAPLGQSHTVDFSLECFFQDFANFNTIFGKKRSDTTTNVAIGLTRALSEQATLYVRYQYTLADSNIFAYDYRRHLGMLGIEVGF